MPKDSSHDAHGIVYVYDEDDGIKAQGPIYGGSDIRSASRQALSGLRATDAMAAIVLDKNDNPVGWKTRDGDQILATPLPLNI